MFKRKAAVAAVIPAFLLISGCAGEGQITDQGVIAVRSACPTVAIPAATGDVTLFNPETSRDARAIDVVADITNVRSTCDETGANLASTVTFDVQAQRRDTRGARDVVIPYFAVVVQGGTVIQSKSISRVGLHFADGQARAETRGTASATINRAAATLPADIRTQITRTRKPGDPDAAVDPMSDPKVREAVQRVSFEVLVGFQLTPEQLAYNATR